MSQETPQQAPTVPAQQPAPAPKPTPPLRLEVWGATDKGREREGNEDAIYPHSGSDTFPFKPSPERLVKKGQLLVVADGVGGAQAGAEASRWAIRVAVERYYDMPGTDLGADLQAAIEVANTSLYQYLQTTGTPDAGCTMAAALVHGNVLYVANVGDSRVYLIRNGRIEQQTRDHTLTQQKIDNQIIRPEEAETDGGRNVLTRSLGARQAVQVDLFPARQLASGDVVLICSDGLTDMLGDREIAQLVGDGSLRRTAQRLIDAANRRGGFDNISVVLARVGGGKRRAGGLGHIAPRRWQKIVLAALVAGVLAVFCGLMGLAAAAIFRPRNDPTPTPTVTVEATTATAPTEMPTAPPTPTPSGATSTPRPTSTPAPTVTPKPTNTRIPPTPTPLPDRDGDGIPDQYDVCPDEPGKPEHEGCPDTDGDGIPDHRDECPNRHGGGSSDGCPKKKDDDKPTLPPPP